MGLDKFGRSSDRAQQESAAQRLLYRQSVFPKTSDGDYDCQGKRLCKIGDPVDPADAVNRKTLSAAIADVQSHLEGRISVLNATTDHPIVYTKLVDSLDSNLKTLGNKLQNNIDALDRKHVERISSLTTHADDIERRLLAELKTIARINESEKKKLLQKVEEVILPRALEDLRQNLTSWFNTELVSIENDLRSLKDSLPLIHYVEAEEED